jgi:hypothetical protein
MPGFINFEENIDDSIDIIIRAPVLNSGIKYLRNQPRKLQSISDIN